MTAFLYRLYYRYWAISHWFGRRLTPAGKFVLVGIVASAWAGIDTNLSMAYQLFTLLSALMATAVLLSLRFDCRLTVTRHLPSLASAGQPLVYHLEARNGSHRSERALVVGEVASDPRPSLEDFAHTPEPKESTRSRYDRFMRYHRWAWLIKRNRIADHQPVVIPRMAPGATLRLRLEVVPQHRGVMQLEAVTVSRTDPLGLVRAVKVISLPGSIPVLPRRYRVPDLALPGGRKYQSGGVAMAGSVGDSEEFVSLRDYRPGDPLRRVHWRSWARTGRPIVKEYQDEFFVRHALVLDTMTSMAYSRDFETAVSIAASFACSIQTQESLLDLMFVGTEAYCFTAGRGLGGIPKILEILAAVGPSRQRFEALATLVLQRAGRISSCICILMGWSPSRRRFARRLEQTGVPITLLAVGPVPPEPVPPPDLGGGSAVHFIQPETAAEQLAALQGVSGRRQ